MTVLALGGLLVSGAAAAQDFDNPTRGDVPCVALSRYVVDTVGGSSNGAVHRAEAAVNNICGRSVEVEFCVRLIEAVDGADRTCTLELLRPWSSSSVLRVDAPVRLAGPEFNWRFLR